MKVIKIVLVLVAALFGIATIFAGTRVLLGSDPGYIVFRPLLIYNTAMGIVYVAAAIIAWRNPQTWHVYGSRYIRSESCGTGSNLLTVYKRELNCC